MIALEILGLKEGDTEKEIRAAYSRLMKRVHPDVGGSDFFAKQLNDARDVLLKQYAIEAGQRAQAERQRQEAETLRRAEKEEQEEAKARQQAEGEKRRQETEVVKAE
jgi:curved DNA-binding protein CbpA